MLSVVSVVVFLLSVVSVVVFLLSVVSVIFLLFVTFSISYGALSRKCGCAAEFGYFIPYIL